MSLTDKLFPWQKNLVEKFKTKDKYGLFLDCGLGKTVIALSLAEVNECSKIIIISINAKATESADVKGSWLNWAKQMKLDYKVYDKKIFNPSKKRPFNGFTKEPEILILNYESLYSRAEDKKSRVELKPQVLDFLKNCKGEKVAILIDECHKVKELKSLQTGAIVKICKYAEMYSSQSYLYMLTGTPFTTGFIDLYSQLKLLGVNMTKTEFIEKFCVRGHVPNLADYQQPIVGYKNVDLLYSLIHKFAITIKSDEVVNLPDKVFVDHVSEKSRMFDLLTKEKLYAEEIMDELANRNIFVKNFKKLSVDQKNLTLNQVGCKIVDDKVYCEEKKLPVASAEEQSLLQILKLALDSTKDVFLQIKIRQLMTTIAAIETSKKGKINNPFYRNLSFPDTKWTAETTAIFWLREREASIGFQGNGEEYLWYDKSRLQDLKNFLAVNENNYIIFYNYTPELFAIFDICEELGYNIDVYAGEIKSLANYEEYEKQTEEERLVNKKNIILANFASGSTGKNWQLYNQVIIFSIPLYKDYEQGIKRIHRIGQHETCVYHMFYQDNVIDNEMRKCLEAAVNYSKEMFEKDIARINELKSDPAKS